ncbi:MAG: hypothetical protein OEV28_07080 [Nitrospirota bacterium]|nr:hypothetical protein [Nitrospirota bacterium]
MMDVIEKIFIWGIPLLVIFVALRARGAHRDLNSVFKRLAQETGGKLSRSDEIRYPILTVNHQGREFVITNGLATGGEVWVTKLSLDNHLDQPFQLRIQPTDPIEEFSKKLGFQDVELGNADFDKQYLVKTQDASRAKTLVDRELQQLLVDIRPLQPELWITEKYIALSTQMQHDLDGYRKLVKLGRKLCELRNK